MAIFFFFSRIDSPSDFLLLKISEFAELKPIFFKGSPPFFPLGKKAKVSDFLCSLILLEDLLLPRILLPLLAKLEVFRILCWLFMALLEIWVRLMLLLDFLTFCWLKYFFYDFWGIYFIFCFFLPFLKSMIYNFYVSVI